MDARCDRLRPTNNFYFVAPLTAMYNTNTSGAGGGDTSDLLTIQNGSLLCVRSFCCCCLFVLRCFVFVWSDFNRTANLWTKPDIHYDSGVLVYSDCTV